mmetsp:Transcript_8608/g.18733  ORF Transcript_8608/g.18733 Transcript_8608/m.18733 type:complete len:222 (-) Transcript_8608:1282-1947(-)
MRGRAFSADSEWLGPVALDLRPRRGVGGRRLFPRAADKAHVSHAAIARHLRRCHTRRRVEAHPQSWVAQDLAEIAPRQQHRHRTPTLSAPVGSHLRIAAPARAENELRSREVEHVHQRIDEAPAVAKVAPLRRALSPCIHQPVVVLLDETLVGGLRVRRQVKARITQRGGAHTPLCRALNDLVDLADEARPVRGAAPREQQLGARRAILLARERHGRGAYD